VVLLHPAGLELSYWDRQIAALCPEHDTVAFDLPGHGRTPGRPEDWTLDAATGAVVETIEALGVDTIHLVGLSLGGILAQACALTRPSLVRSLTLVDTAASFPEAGRTAMRERADAAREGGMAAVVASLLDHWFMPQTAERRPDLIDRAVKTLLADDPLVHAAMWEMIASVELLEDLPQIACPTLVLVGEFDATSPVAAAQAMRDAIPGARMQVVARAAHMSPLEEPDAINAHLLAFLAQTEAS